MEFETTLDWQLVQSIMIALALGGLIGLERQSHHDAENPIESVGLRTFALAALLGCLSVLAAPISPAVPYIAGIGYLLLVVAFLYFEFRTRETTPGITTQVSALLVYVIGAIVPSEPVLASVIAVLVASILSVKDWTHRLVKNLSEEEVLGTMKFLLVSVVLLPILPSEPIDPWDIYNLQEIWLLVVLVSGISFAGYFAIRFFGRDRGIALTGALGGLASSTAVTLAMAQRVKAADDNRSVVTAAAFAILIASGIMTVRVVFLVLAVNATFATVLWLPLGAMAVPGILVAWYFWSRIADGDPEEPEAANGELEDRGEESKQSAFDDADDDLEISNPFELSPALKFGLLFMVIIGGVELAHQAFENSGTYVASLLSGLANMDAISVTLARMVESGDVTDLIGARGVVIAVIANSFSKAAMATMLGSKRLGAYVVAGLLPTAAVGGAVVYWM
ncbi:MAG: MgtC/SapB family protein [Bradymonadaceae bacterium]